MLFDLNEERPNFARTPAQMERGMRVGRLQNETARTDAIVSFYTHLCLALSEPRPRMRE